MVELIFQLVINGPSLVSKLRLVALTLLDGTLQQDVPPTDQDGKITYFLSQCISGLPHMSR